MQEFLGFRVIASFMASFLLINTVTLFQNFGFFRRFLRIYVVPKEVQLPDSTMEFQFPYETAKEVGGTMRIGTTKKTTKILLDGEDAK